MASELSELRAELWRTRDDLVRMKSRTPTTIDSVDRSTSRRAFDHRHHRHTHAGGKRTSSRDIDDQPWPRQDGEIKATKSDLGGGGGGIRSGPTSPPTSGHSSGSDRHIDVNYGSGSSGGGQNLSGIRAEAEETLCNLELEGAAFKNWTEEASSIAVRLIEEVKTLRWERATWAEREAAAEREASDLRARTEALEKRLRDMEIEGTQSKEALARARQAEKEQVGATERARAELRAAQEKAGELRAQMAGSGGGGLREELRREKEGADALQRRLDAARAAAAEHERERKEWRASRARLEELRRSWGKQVRKVCV